MTEPTPPPPPSRMLLRIPMRRAPIVPDSARAAAVYGALLVAWILWPFGNPPPGVAASPPAPGLVLAAYVGVVLAVVAFHLRFVRAERPEALELREDTLTLPVAPGAARTVTLPYTDVWGCDVFEEGRARLIVHTILGGYEYPLDQMDDAAHAGRVRAVLRERLGALPDDGEALRAFDARSTLGAAMLARVPRLPWVLTASLGGAYVVEMVTGAVDNPLQMIRLGACVPALVRAGELHRLVSANLLHANALHLAFNCASLFSLALTLEFALGPWRLLLTLLVAGLVGVAASAASGAAMSVGASAAAFGLLGALLWVHLAHGRTLPAEIRQTQRTWRTIALLNVSLPFVFPVIDWRAHAAGLVAGLVVGWLVTPAGDTLDPHEPTPAPLRAAALLMAAVYAVGLGLAARDARRPWQEVATRALTALAREEAPPAQLNELAWFAVTARDATAPLLRAAAAATAQAIRHDAQPALQDTHAQALHRLGRWDEAIPFELAAVDGREAAPSPDFYPTQLARFLAARPSTQGPWRGDAERVEVTATWAGGAVTIHAGDRARAQRVGVLVREGGALRSLVLVCFAPGAAREERVTVAGGGAGWRAEVAMVRGVDRCDAPTRAYRMAPEALQLP